MELSAIPVISALWLGILTSISPCPLAANIAAVSFIIKGSPSQGVFPEYIIFINDQQVFSGFCSGIWKPCFYVMDSALKAETISILYTNDNDCYIVGKREDDLIYWYN